MFQLRYLFLCEHTNPCYFVNFKRIDQKAPTEAREKGAYETYCSKQEGETVFGTSSSVPGQNEAKALRSSLFARPTPTLPQN